MSRTTRRYRGSARLTWLASIGCALALLLWIAVGPAAAGTVKSASEGLSPPSQQLGDSLVLPSLDQIVGGEEVQLAHAARRSNPAAIARRVASHSAFEGLSSRTAIGEAKHAFPALLDHTAGGVPSLSSGERIVRYLTGNAAQVALPGRVGVIETLEPIASGRSHGAHVPFDLQLVRGGDGYKPVRSAVGLSVPSALSRGVELPQIGVSLVPVDRRGVALAASAGQSDGAGVFWNVATGGPVRDLATLAKASPRGFDLSTLLFSQDSPSQLYFRVRMPAGARLLRKRDGSVQIVNGHETIAVVSPVSAEDAEGTSVPTSVSVNGAVISVHVDTSGDYLYPIVVDPEVNDSQLAKTSAGKRSNWEFQTNSAHFTSSAVYEGPGAEHLETRASGGYGGSEYGYWGYQTKGVSHIYEIKTETSAHNSGAKVESFLEFEEPPSGARETKKILSTPYENPEYERKAATLCAANASKVEECLPGSGKAGNSVHFQQSTTGSSSTGFSDTMSQGIVSIAEPSGTHSATGYNTSSPTLEFETEVEGKKVKVARQNVLYGSGGWLSSSNGALALNSSDPGIGVAATKLEYESSAGHFSQLYEHNYLGVENACQGVQCYSSHTEDTTLPLGLPDGEQTLRYRAEEAISGTQSLEGEGQAKVKVDTTAPHNLQIEGLPYGNELSEREYKLTGVATDGEGSTVASSGIKSIALLVDGHEFGTAGGSCGVAKGACTASTNWAVSGATLGAGKHDIEIVATDKAGNEARRYEPITIRHSTPVPLGPGSVDLESGDFALSATDASLGSGLTVARSYSSRSSLSGATGALGAPWAISVGNTQSIVELVDGSVMLIAGDGSQTIFASIGEDKFAPPTGDSNLTLSLEENKEKQKLAYYLKNAAAGTSVKFTQPPGSSEWLPVKQEGTTSNDTVAFSYSSSIESRQEFSMPHGGGSVTTGPDQNLWMSGSVFDDISKVTPWGKVTEYPAPGCPGEITSGPDGSLWFTDYCTNTIDKMTTSGAITAYPVIKEGVGGQPQGLTVGPEGNLWFSESKDAIGKITTSGVVTQYALPAAALNIVAGPGGLWFTEPQAGKIGRITTSGLITEYATAPGTTPNFITSGPDGNLWFTTLTSIGKITPGGAITEYPLKREETGRAIAPGPDGNLWFTEEAGIHSGQDAIAKITTTGQITEYPLGTGTGALGVTAGPEGEMWFALPAAHKLDRMTTSGHITVPTEEIAPPPAGVLCEPLFNLGCRALKFKYATSTTATGEGASELGEFKTRLSEVLLLAYDPSSKLLKETAVAKYAYDKYGRLRAEWDPRISPSLKTTYGYDESGHVTVLAQPGQQPWLMTYGTYTFGTEVNDLANGRLLKVARTPASNELWKGEVLTNTEAPKITGTPRWDVTLTVSNGKWSGAPFGYAYQWSRCKAGSCSVIPGATNQNYKPWNFDIGYTLSATVTATNGGGSVAVNSSSTSEIQNSVHFTETYVPGGNSVASLAEGPVAKTSWLGLYNGVIDKMTSSGVVTEYTMPGGGYARDIARSGDGSAWFTNQYGNKVGRVTPAGAVTEWAVPGGSIPAGLTYGADGNIWFVDSHSKKVSKITSAGAITEYPMAASSDPEYIASGSDGNLWITDTANSRIDRMTTSGVVTEYSLPTGSGPTRIAAGPDGNLWFVDKTTEKIGKITTAGAITEYALPSGTPPPEYISAGAGALWVTAGGKLLKLETSGAVTVYGPINGVLHALTVHDEEVWAASSLEVDRTPISGLAEDEVVEGETRSPQPGTTIEYRVPVDGLGAPYEMGAPEVARWGQDDDPHEATAIFPPDAPQSWPLTPLTSYKRATVYYLDEQGREVNVASPSNSSYGSVSTTEYNEFNDPIRELSPDDRQVALEAGAGSVAKSKLLDTQNTYNGEGAKEGEVAEPGTRLVESLGPEHKITYVAGHEQKESLARLHSEFSYDEGAPSGETYDLQTKKTTVAQLINNKEERSGEEVEARTTKTSYSDEGTVGWRLRAPTSVTTIDPEGNTLTKSATEYNSTTGQVTESRGTSAETTLSYVKKFGEVGSETGKLKAPWGAVVNAEGQLLVVDSANSRVEKFSAEGVFVSSFGTAGSGNGQLKEPQGIALDASGNVWVADTGNNRVEEFSSAGAFVKTVGSLGTESGKLKAPSDLAFDSKGNLWVADTGNSRVEKFNKEGVYSSEFGSAGSEPGKLKEPEGIVVDSGEHVWVVDTGNNRIEEFSTTGSLLKRFGSSGSGEGQLNTPIDLKIDAQGNLWTADSKNNRAEAFTPTGSYVTQIGFKGTAAGQLSEPKGIAFDATGKAWVVDSANNRLEQWSKGSNAHDEKTIYYSAAANTEGYAACGSRPEWAGLVCETLPAKQPELMGLPPLPVTTYAYNVLDEPETVTETFGSSSRVRKETYDAAGRRTASETTATSGKALPQVTFSYNSEQGVLEKETAEGKSLTSEYNHLGQLTKYTDADGNVAKYSYAAPEGDYLLTEVSDSSAGATSKQSFEYDPTTKLPTKLIDSAAGTFTAAYNTEGQTTSLSYPHGMCELYAYNSIGETTSLEYTKSSNCAESEPGIYYQDSRSSSIRGEMLDQSSTLASETYTYDPSGRLTETQETPAGEGCTVRAYTYDEEADRATSATRSPGTGGVCQSEGGTVEGHNYDEGDRLADPEVGYDAFGNVTKLPAADAEGHELTTSFYVDNAVAGQTQNGVTNEYKPDPEGRTRELISGSTKTIDHYDGPGETVAWSESPEKWVRNITGIDGALLATQTNGETPVLQLHDLQGDVVATIGDKAGETKLLTTYNSTEFGVPKGGKAPPKLGWLGAADVESSLSSGVITYGATSYVPQTGRALQSEPVAAPGLPGGSGAGAPYTMLEEPWNMQGAAREAAEAPGLEAAREQTALEAALAAALAEEEAMEEEGEEESLGWGDTSSGSGGGGHHGHHKSGGRRVNIAGLAMLKYQEGGSCLPAARCKREEREMKEDLKRFEQKKHKLEEELRNKAIGQAAFEQAIEESRALAEAYIDGMEDAE
jgi:streptogramin lyase